MTAYEMRARGKAVILTAIGWAIYVVGVGLALWWTITLVGTGDATVGDVAVVIALAGNLQDQIMGALSSRVRVAEAGPRHRPLPLAGGADRAGCRSRTTRCRRSGPASGWTASRSGYPGSAGAALDEVDLDVPAGSVLGVVGVNGAGKSTLAKVLTGLYTPTSGRVLVDGRVAQPGRAVAGHGGRVPGLLRIPVPRPGDRRGRGSPADRGPACGAGRGAEGAGDRARRAAGRALGDPARASSSTGRGCPRESGSGWRWPAG